MKQETSCLLRGLAFGALVMLCGCAAGPGVDDTGMTSDPAANHPISVEPSYQSLKLDYSPYGLAPDESMHFDAFLGDYKAHGTGSISISVPQGAGAASEIAWFADHIADAGVPRNHILTALHDAGPDSRNPDRRVELNYISYQAHTGACGDWSEDLSFTLDNSTAKNFGCSVQQNIAAMVADPRDLLGPRPMDDADAVRRGTVLGNYEQGKVTAADLSESQKAAITDVGK